MCDQDTLNKIDNGKALVVTKKHIAWGAIATILVFLLSQAAIFGIWKGTTDEKIDNNTKAIQILKEREVPKIKSELKTLNRIEHNLIRLFEQQGIKYDWEFGK